MSDLLVIFGATGQQGGSLAFFVLSDPALSARYRVRGITRDATQPAAAALRARGAEVVQADLDDSSSSLQTALAGAHTVFITTTTVYHDGDGGGNRTKEREVRQGKAAVDAAVAAGARFIVYSTEVHCEMLSGGKHRVPAFDSRGEVEGYIRSLRSVCGVRSAFYAPGSFMQNFGGMMAPRRVQVSGDGDGEQAGVYAIRNIVTGDCVFPWIDVVKDTGKVVGAILAEPERFEGRTVYAAGGLLSFEEVAAKLSRHTGKKVRYEMVSEEEFRGYLPPAARDPVMSMFRFIGEYGYYGPETERRVKETAALLPCELTALDEYIAGSVWLE